MQNGDKYSWSALMCWTPGHDFLQMAKLRGKKKNKKNGKVALRGSSPVTLSFTQNMSFTTAAQAPSTCVLIGGRAARESVFQESHKRPFKTAAPSIQPSSRSKRRPSECVLTLKRNEERDTQITDPCQTPRCRTFQLPRRLEVLPENTSGQS